MTYDASSIKVLSQDEIRKTQAWALSGALSVEYPTTPVHIIQKGLQVVDLLGEEYLSYFIERYLKGDRSIPISETFSEAYKHMK